MLEGVNVALGVTGSIAAVKTVELAHELRRRGADVRAVMTDSARGIVHPWALEFATDADVVTEITGGVEHVSLCGYDGWADVFVIAPATANTVGKIAAAVDDTPVTTCATTALGAGTPVVIAPRCTSRCTTTRRPRGHRDRRGMGRRLRGAANRGRKAKIATEEAIVCETARAAGERPLEGTQVVVTSGATSESIDPVRVLTNRSSGKMGRAVTRSCYVRGADVTLVHGEAVPYADVRPVESAAEMLAATREAASSADVLVSAAAIGDYTVEASNEKIRSGQELTLELEPTPKLIDAVREAADVADRRLQDRDVRGRGGDDRAGAGGDRPDGPRVRRGQRRQRDGQSGDAGAAGSRNDAARYEGTKAGLGEEIADSIAVMLA